VKKQKTGNLWMIHLFENIVHEWWTDGKADLVQCILDYLVYDTSSTVHGQLYHLRNMFVKTGHSTNTYRLLFKTHSINSHDWIKCPIITLTQFQQPAIFHVHCDFGQQLKNSKISGDWTRGWKFEDGDFSFMCTNQIQKIYDLEEVPVLNDGTELPGLSFGACIESFLELDTIVKHETCKYIYTAMLASSLSAKTSTAHVHLSFCGQSISNHNGFDNFVTEPIVVKSISFKSTIIPLTVTNFVDEVIVETHHCDRILHNEKCFMKKLIVKQFNSCCLTNIDYDCFFMEPKFQSLVIESRNLDLRGCMKYIGGPKCANVTDVCSVFFKEILISANKRSQCNTNPLHLSVLLEFGPTPLNSFQIAVIEKLTILSDSQFIKSIMTKANIEFCFQISSGENIHNKRKLEVDMKPSKRIKI
jgi:hypothetical protein